MSKKIIEIIKTLGIIIIMLSIELFIRFQPEMQEQHVSIFDEVPLLFDFCYIIMVIGIISFVETIVPCFNRLISKIVMELVYGIVSLLFFAEFIYCRIFGRIFSLSEITYADEGAQFIGVVFQYVDLVLISYVIIIIVGGIVIWKIFPDFSYWSSRKKGLLSVVISVSALILIIIIPHLFKTTEDPNNWNNKGVIYQKWSHNKRAFAMFGGYEYLVRDLYLMIKGNEVSIEEIAQIKEYMANNTIKNNNMTNQFVGKNLILVLMESMDDWLISEEETPTICYLMNHGINFTNMYTPVFGTSYTLNTEFASYTGLFAPSSGGAVLHYANNSLEDALPYLFKSQGYNTAAYHYNNGGFYNRFNIHHSAGFEKYVSYLDYLSESEAELDTSLVDCEKIWSQFIEKKPFFNYLITYSAHGRAGVSMPYSYDDIAIEVQPEYKGKYETEELDAIYAKAHVTDEMFAKLLKQLEIEGVLEDTVIIGFTDHYSYCFKDDEYMMEVSNAQNEYELSKTPLFIWTPGIESFQMDKVCNTSDIYPTICNLFGLCPQNGFLGGDIFSEDYIGYAYWPDRSWITNEGRYYRTTDRYIGNLTEEDIKTMSELVEKRIQINDAILNSNFYLYD